jgi:Uma2 family endonuclease
MASVADSSETVLIDTEFLNSEVFYEVVGGQVVEKPPMGVRESTLASLLIELIGPYARNMKLGQVFSEVLFDFRPFVHVSRRPDLAFLSVAKGHSTVVAPRVSHGPSSPTSRLRS